MTSKQKKPQSIIKNNILRKKTDLSESADSWSGLCLLVEFELNCQISFLINPELWFSPLRQKTQRYRKQKGIPHYTIRIRKKRIFLMSVKSFNPFWLDKEV